MKLTKKQYTKLFNFLAIVAIALSVWVVFTGAGTASVVCSLVALFAIWYGIRLTRKLPDDSVRSPTSTIGYPSISDTTENTKKN